MFLACVTLILIRMVRYANPNGFGNKGEGENRVDVYRQVIKTSPCNIRSRRKGSPRTKQNILSEFNFVKGTFDIHTIYSSVALKPATKIIGRSRSIRANGKRRSFLRTHRPTACTIFIARHGGFAYSVPQKENKMK